MAEAAELGQIWMKGISGERAKMLHPIRVLSCLDFMVGCRNVENGHLTAVPGRKFTNPFGVLQPEIPKGGGQGFQTMPVPEFGLS